MTGMETSPCQIFSRCTIRERAEVVNEMCLVEVAAGEGNI